MSENYNYIDDILENCGNNISYFCGTNNSLEYNYFVNIVDADYFNSKDLGHIVEEKITINKDFASEYRYAIFYEKMINYYNSKNYVEDILLYYYYYFMCGYFNSIVEVFYKNDIVLNIRKEITNMKKIENQSCYYLFNAYLMNMNKYSDKLLDLMNIYDLFDKVVFNNHELLVIPKDNKRKKQLVGNLGLMYFYYKTLFYYCEKYYSEYDVLRIKKIILKNHIENKMEIKKTAIRYFENIDFIYNYYCYGDKNLIENKSIDVIENFKQKSIGEKLIKENESKQEVLKNKKKNKKEKIEKLEDIETNFLKEEKSEKIEEINKMLYSDFFKEKINFENITENTESKGEIIKEEKIEDWAEFVFLEEKDREIGEEDSIVIENYIKQNKMNFIEIRYDHEAEHDDIYYKTYSGKYDIKQLCRENKIKITKELFECDSWVINEFVLPKGVIAKKLLGFLLFYIVNRKNNKLNTFLGDYDIKKYYGKYMNNVNIKLIDFIYKDDET